MALSRGDEERQLLVNYRGGPLAFTSETVGGLDVGDRLPDAFGSTGQRVHHVIAGPQFALLQIGADVSISGSEFALDGISNLSRRRLRSVVLPPGTYGVTNGTHILVRPDGYIAAIGLAAELEHGAHAMRLLGPSG